MAELNIELMDQMLETLRKFPERHDQGWWLSATDDNVEGLKRDEQGVITVDCGTTMCAAGWVSHLAGGQWVDTGRLLAENDDDQDDITKNDIVTVYADNDYWHPIHRRFDTVTAYARAKRLLGLNDDEANSLFYVAGDLEGVEEVAAAIKQGVYR